MVWSYFCRSNFTIDSTLHFSQRLTVGGRVSWTADRTSYTLLKFGENQLFCRKTVELPSCYVRTGNTELAQHDVWSGDVLVNWTEALPPLLANCLNCCSHFSEANCGLCVHDGGMSISCGSIENDCGPTTQPHTCASDKHIPNIRAGLRKLHVWWGRLKCCRRPLWLSADTWLTETKVAVSFFFFLYPRCPSCQFGAEGKYSEE